MWQATTCAWTRRQGCCPCSAGLKSTRRGPCRRRPRRHQSPLPTRGCLPVERQAAALRHRRRGLPLRPTRRPPLEARPPLPDRPMGRSGCWRSTCRRRCGPRGGAPRCAGGRGRLSLTRPPRSTRRRRRRHRRCRPSRQAGPSRRAPLPLTVRPKHRRRARQTRRRRPALGWPSLPSRRASPALSRQTSPADGWPAPVSWWDRRPPRTPPPRPPIRSEWPRWHPFTRLSPRGRGTSAAVAKSACRCATTTT